MTGLQDKLKTNLERGLTPTDFEERENHFGSNFKAPPKRTPYWRLFLGALDDFMLKFLLVCASVEMAIEVGFAEHDERQTGMYRSIFIYGLFPPYLLSLFYSFSYLIL
jgi:magnesium-transporting ATPase (P-type)